MRIALIVVKVLLTLAFLAAGLAKLAGAAPMVESFEVLGLGQWFRYVTGIIEVAGAVLLWVPGLQYLGASLLGGTMVGAVLAHLTILGIASGAPAVILGLMCAFVLWRYREQWPIFGPAKA